MVWSRKKRTPSRQKSIKNFIIDGNKISQPETEEVKEKRCVIYCRVSSQGQATYHYWLETQEDTCRQYCEKMWIKVDRVFKDEGISWNEQDRKAFNECSEYLKKVNSKFTQITHFICRDATRISRPDLNNIGAAFELEDKIKQYWVKIEFADWSTYDNTDEGQLMKTLQYAYAWYERKKIQNKCMEGRMTRLRQWYRPFSEPPRGYIREKIWGKDNYIDKIDWDEASILKAWLELFANDPNMSQAELCKFLTSKWFKCWITYLEKMFQIHRLYFYAWYILYPERDINEIREWVHEWIIDLATANKIKDKLQKKKPIVKREKKNDDNFILKHLITCKWCGRKLTWRITKKSNWQEYYYYWCQKDKCPERDNIPKDKLEKQLFDMIKECELSEPMKKLFDAVLDETRWDTEQNLDKIVEWRKKRLQAVKDKKRAIQDNMLDSRISEKLKESLYDQWEELNTEEEMIEDELRNHVILKTHRNSSIQKIKELIRNPLIFWTNSLSDTNLRTKVLEVRFWNSLTYSKSEGVQTSDEPVLYNVLRDLSQKSTLIYQGWDSNPHDREVTRFWV